MVFVGVSTRKFWPSFRDVVEIVDAAGGFCDAVEFWVEPPFFPEWRTDLEKGVLDRIADVLVTHDLELTVHAPFYDLNLASLNPLVRSHSLKEVEKSLEVAESLGANTVTFHPGFWRLDRAFAMSILRESLRRLDAIAGDYSTALCLENMRGKENLCTTPEEMAKALEGFDNIYSTLDLAHVWVHEGRAYEKFIDAAGGRIRNVHVSDIKEKGGHLPLGVLGNDYTTALGMLRKIGYDEIFVLEAEVSDGGVELARMEVETLRAMLEKAGFTPSTDG